MAPLGPFSATRTVAVAVSGGADSTALALLARRWGRPTALIVDHGLRAGSADEAAACAAQMQRIGIPAHVVPVQGLAAGTALQERARIARYAALSRACLARGLVDLLLGHHAADQRETAAIRAAAGSGADGLAAMPALAHTAALRLLRPLLATEPARLRATLRQAGLAWAEDPTNHDPAMARTRLRTASAPGYLPLDRDTCGPAADRAAAEAERSDLLGAAVSIHPEGFAMLPPASLRPDLVRAAVWTVSGRAFPPSWASVAGWLERRRPGTLHGTLLAWQAAAGAWLLCREPSACAPPIAVAPGAMWDGRYVIGPGASSSPGWRLGALGEDSAGLRGMTPLPSVVLRGLPAIRAGGRLEAVPALDVPSAAACRAVPVLFRPARPLAGLAFVPPPRIRGCTDENATLS